MAVNFFVSLLIQKLEPLSFQESPQQELALTCYFHGDLMPQKNQAAPQARWHLVVVRTLSGLGLCIPLTVGSATGLVFFNSWIKLVHNFE